MTHGALSLLRLLQTNDSAFPSGAFAFSSGLETLCNEGRITGAEDVARLLTDQIVPRWLSFDRYFLRAAFDAQGDPEALLALDRWCHLHNTVEGLAKASRRVGRALLTVHARIGTPGVAAYRAKLAESQSGPAAGYDPVVQGLVGQGLGLDAVQSEIGALNSVVTAFTGSAVRLGRLGALDAQNVLATLARTMADGLDDPPPNQPGAFSTLTEIAALRRASDHASLFAT